MHVCSFIKTAPMMNELIAIVKSGKVSRFEHSMWGELYQHHMTCHVGGATLTACGADMDTTATELLAAIEKNEKTKQEEAVRRTEVEQRMQALASNCGVEVRFSVELLCMESYPEQYTVYATLDIGDTLFKKTFDHCDKVPMRARLFSFENAVPWIKQAEAAPSADT
jgi:hypothetical protein